MCQHYIESATALSGIKVHRLLVMIKGDVGMAKRFCKKFGNEG